MTPVTPSSVCDMRKALQIISDSAPDDVSDEDGAVLIALSAAEVLAVRAALAERTQQEAQPECYELKRYLTDVLEAGNVSEMVVAQTALRMIAEPLLFAHPASAADCAAPMQPSDDWRIYENWHATAEALRKCPSIDMTARMLVGILGSLAAPTQAAPAAAAPEGLTTKQAAELLLGKHPATPDAKTAEERMPQPLTEAEFEMLKDHFLTANYRLARQMLGIGDQP